MVELILDDGEKTEVAQGTAFSEILEKLNEEFIQKAVAVKVNGRVFDIRQKVTEGGNFKVLTIGATEALGILRHSTSHLMALAVQQLFENVKFAIGPAIEDGFYYDFLLDRTFTPDDLERIEEKMRELQKSNELEFTREDMPKQKAIELFTEHDQPFKVELINELDNDTVSVYRLGSFIDLCAGPHLSDIKMAHAFKLLSIAGAYWRGDEQREMLQRVYGTAFFEEADLENELERREEAKRRDHRRLGPSLELFDTKEEAGGGLVFWYPKGYVLREIIENYWKKEHRKEGYEIVLTPHIAKSDLWKRSGHYDYYHENMYIIRDEEQEFVLKPMNCPAHILIYKSKLRSYRDLPIRYAELGTVYRKERSGTLHGLLRVRGFTQDDAHIFCSPGQLLREVEKCFDFAHRLLTSFGFDKYEVILSAHDPSQMDKYAGTEEEWQKAEEALLSTIEKRDIPFKTIEGEAVFYGPKIDLKLIDAIGRGWQATTIQFDFNLPRRFDMVYVTPEGKREYVYMIHRALLGSLERFIGTLTEHYAGEFPLWLAPVQVMVFPIGPDQHEYAGICVDQMKQAGIRVEGDYREEKIGYRIREAELQKIPYMVVVGGREAEAKTIDVRSKANGRLGTKKIEEFIPELVDEVDKKA